MPDRLRGLGRRIPEDRNHIQKYPYAALGFATPTTVERALRLLPYSAAYNQRRTHGCVGYSSSWMMSLLNRRRYDPVWLWNEAKLVDPFADTQPGDRSETTVRAAMDVLRAQGHRRVFGGRELDPRRSDGITVNRWATSVDEIRTSISRGTPVVLGIDWYASFDNPVRDGREWWIGRERLGRKVGGHAVCIYRASDRLNAVGIVNSWGPRYPLALMDYALLQRLLDQDGEATLVTDRRNR
ncbi:MAG: hypothetical protein QOI98_2348 [Solirubrobacteraceae bacterium]|jgi:hypothetical protein|nr:hypothetical protein [Solirubrobacteraceae bacterium]